MKRELHLTILMLGFLGLMSCTGKKSHIVLAAEHVRGLTNKSKLTLNGYEVGKVSKLSLGKYGRKVIVDCKIENETKIPKDSKFYIESGLVLGQPDLKIVLGESNQYLNSEDTVKLEIEKTSILSDSLSTEIGDFLKGMFGTKKQDSILIELRRLNENLEKIKNQKD